MKKNTGHCCNSTPKIKISTICLAGERDMMEGREGALGDQESKTGKDLSS